MDLSLFHILREKKIVKEKPLEITVLFYPDMMSYPFKNKAQTSMFPHTQAESSHSQEFL